MIYTVEAITDLGTLYEVYGSKAEAKARRRELDSEDDSNQTFDIDSFPTPKTKADWMRFINAHMGKAR